MPFGDEGDGGAGVQLAPEGEGEGGMGYEGGAAPAQTPGAGAAPAVAPAQPQPAVQTPGTAAQQAAFLKAKFKGEERELTEEQARNFAELGLLYNERAEGLGALRPFADAFQQDPALYQHFVQTWNQSLQSYGQGGQGQPQGGQEPPAGMFTPEEQQLYQQGALPIETVEQKVRELAGSVVEQKLGQFTQTQQAQTQRAQADQRLNQEVQDALTKVPEVATMFEGLRGARPDIDKAIILTVAQGLMQSRGQVPPLAEVAAMIPKALAPYIEKKAAELAGLRQRGVSAAEPAGGVAATAVKKKTYGDVDEAFDELWPDSGL